MKRLMLKKIGLVILIGLILSFSCGGKVTTRSNPTKYKFTINGVVVKDLSLGKDIAYIKVLRDSVAFDTAVVKVGGYTLNNQKGGKYFKEASTLFNFGQNVSLSISSTKDSFSLDTSVIMPGSFYINQLPLDGDTLNPGGKSVKVTWSISLLASGYFLTVATPDIVPGAVGFTKLVKGNEETILPDAFRTTQGSLVEGVYELYVIAYYGSFLEYPGMIFELPIGLPTNNIENANGTIGAGVVAQKKRIRVVVAQ